MDDGTYSGHTYFQGPGDHQCSVDCCCHVSSRAYNYSTPFTEIASQGSYTEYSYFQTSYHNAQENNLMPVYNSVHDPYYMTYYQGTSGVQAIQHQRRNTSPAVPVTPLSTSTCVHINPNFRAKSGHPDSDVKMNSVHFNPHWRPKTDKSHFAAEDKIITTDSPVDKDGRLDNTTVKKTIHINPKMIAQMKSGGGRCVVSSQNVLERVHLPPLSNSSDSALLSANKGMSDSDDSLCNKSQASATICTPINIEKEASNQSNSKNQARITRETNNGQSKLVALSSTKLVRKTDRSPGVPKVPPSAKLSNSSHNVSEVSDRSWSSLRTAKLVCSKYKFFRQSPSSGLCASRSKNSFTDSPRQLRIKALCNSRMLQHQTSIYKFVKTERNMDAESISETSRYKLVKSNKPTDHTSESVLKYRRNSAGIKVSKSHKLVKGIPEQLKPKLVGKTISSRFKLLREAPNMHIGGRRSVDSKLKLVRVAIAGRQCKAQKSVKSRFKLVRIPSQAASGKKVTKYCIIRNSPFMKSKLGHPSQFRFPRYLRSSNTPLNRYTGKSGQYFGLYGNRVWSSGQALAPKPVTVSNHRLLRIGSLPQKCQGRLKRVASHSGKLLNIGGVLYRSTRTTLTRTPTEGEGERVVYVRGKKFILNAEGTTLRQVSNQESSSQVAQGELTLGRLDIGGVTFRRIGGSTLVRTDTHKTRSLLSQAKVRSIALLTDRLRKNNQPCLIYQRFGKCQAQEKGKCWRVHDPKKIAICRKFLQGNCEAEKCLLSHDVGPEKMPTCRYFLEGCCVRENCPYLHVKLSAQTAICRDFLGGYCVAADMCKFRHIHLCPDFEREGKCSKGKYCPYPHKGQVKSKVKQNCKAQPQVSKSKSKPKSRKERCVEDVKSKKKRYYHESKDENHEANSDCSEEMSGKRSRIMKQVNLMKHIRQAVISGEEVVCPVEPEPRSSSNELHVPLVRPKLGILPSYIPLE